VRKRIKQKNEKKGENKKKPGIQRVLHLSYDRTDSRRECPTQCHSRNRDHRVQHRRPRLDDVMTTMTTTARRYHLLFPTVVPGTRLSITRFKRCRLPRRRDERNKTEANARTAHDLHVERLSYLHSSFRSKVTLVRRDDYTVSRKKNFGGKRVLYSRRFLILKNC
jgi:hypothetical protein